MRTPRRLNDEHVILAARAMSTEELCHFATEYEELGDRSLAALYSDALSVQAREISWGEIIRLSMTGWKEEECGQDQNHQARVLD